MFPNHVVCLVAAVLVAGCSSKPNRDSDVVPAASAGSERAAEVDTSADRITITSLETEPGLSGLAFDAAGALWAVAERGGALVSVMPGEPRARTQRKVIGIPEGLDLESVDFLDDGRVVFGTESDDDDREADILLFADIDGDEVRVTDTLAMSYKAWDQACEGNQGIEAVCAASGRVVALGESQLPVTEQRQAPLGVYDLAAKTWSTYRLALTSDRGKIAGATCRATPGGLEILALERHFGVRRVLRWTVPLEAAAKRNDAPIRPEIAYDFTELSEDNPEGIDWLPDGKLVVVTDNQSGRVVKGDGKLLVLNVEN